MQFMVCIVHSCGPATTTISIVVVAGPRRGCYQNKIQESASRWFYYTIYNDAGQ